MSNSNNNNKQNKQNTAPAVATATPTSPVLETPAASAIEVAAPATSTAIEVTADVPVSALTKRYKDALPHMAAYLDQVTPPNPGEIQDALAALSPEKRAAFTAALSRMNPIKAGQHTSRSEFRLPEMRVFQGTGTDELRPSDCPQGGVYTTDGRILSAPKEALANLKHNPKYKNLDTTVRGFVIGVHEAHTFWPPRSGNLPPGIEVRTNAPICRSVDRQRGDYFGSCAACTHRPFMDGKANSKDACRNEDHIYFVPADFSGVYRIVFHGKSIKPGSAFIKKKTRPWAAYYEHAFELDAKAVVRGQERWFELTASVASEVPDPSAEEEALLNALVRQVDYEVYFPQLYAIYTAEPKVLADAGSSSDMAALLKNAGNVGSTKDVSKIGL
jgi:hypothetical protein